MKLTTRAPSHAAATNPVAEQHSPPMTLPDRSQLKALDRFRVNRSTSRAAREAVGEVERLAIEAAKDVAATAIKHRRSEAKAALASAAVVRYAAIAQELVARTAVAQEQLTAVQFEGFKRLIAQRKRQLEDVNEALKRGELTDQEAQASMDFIHEKMVSDSERLDAAATRAKDVVGEHVIGATDHIRRLGSQD